MYSYYGLNADVTERFEELERELDRPINLLLWQQPRSRRPFSYYSVAEGGDERGITIMLGGGEFRLEPARYIYRDENEDEVSYEVFSPAEPPAMPIEVDGELVGEIVLPNQVFMYIHWPHHDGEWVPALIDATITAVRACVDPNILENWDEHQEERRREALVQFVRSTYDRQLREHRDYIDACQYAISEAQQQLAVNLRNVRQRQELLDAVLLVRENDTGENVLRDWELLQQHPRVDRCTFKMNQLVITTTDDLRLVRDDTNESRWLGAFEIRIDLSNLSINMTNLTTRRGGRDHPHVTDGAPCFGGHANDFAQLLGNGELLVVFELCIQYLERLNLADEYGRYGSYWFDVPDERPLVEIDEATPDQIEGALEAAGV